jgi:hypothetical protein
MLNSPCRALGRRGPLASLSQAELVGEPAIGPDLVTERQTSGMPVSIGANVECFPSPAGWRHSPESPVRRSRFGATAPIGWPLGISRHTTRVG